MLIKRSRLPQSKEVSLETLNAFLAQFFEPFVQEQIDYSEYEGYDARMAQFDADYNIVSRNCPIPDRHRLDNAAQNYIVAICKSTTGRT
jgi:hypothetical protein